MHTACVCLAPIAAGGQSYVMSFVICILHQILIRKIKIGENEMDGHVTRMGMMGNVYKIFV
jgi:hypothetical protein